MYSCQQQKFVATKGTGDNDVMLVEYPKFLLKNYVIFVFTVDTPKVSAALDAALKADDGPLR